MYRFIKRTQYPDNLIIYSTILCAFCFTIAASTPLATLKPQQTGVKFWSVWSGLQGLHKYNSSTYSLNMSYPAKPEDWSRPECKFYDHIIWYEAKFSVGCVYIKARCGNRDPEKNVAENLSQLEQSPILDIRLYQDQCITEVKTVNQRYVEDVCKYMNDDPDRVTITEVKLKYGGVDYANVVIMSLMGRINFDNGRVPQEENQSPRVSKTAESLGGESVTPSFENGQVPLGENQFRQRPSSSGGESVTPSLENGQVPLGEDQSPRVSKTAKSLWGRISHPEFRKRPSPSGGESVTPGAFICCGCIGSTVYRFRKVRQLIFRKPWRWADGFRKRPSPSGGESVTPSFENGQVPLGENQSPRVSKTAKSIRGRRLISTMSDFHPSHSPAWPPTPMVTSSRRTAKKVLGTIGSPREMRSTSRY
jgi:hypothetical protein